MFENNISTSGRRVRTGAFLLLLASVADGAVLRSMSGMGRVPCCAGALETLAYVAAPGVRQVVGGVGGGSRPSLDCFARRTEGLRRSFKVAMGLDDRGHGLGLKPAKKGIHMKTSLHQSSAFPFPTPPIERPMPADRWPTLPFRIAPQAALLIVAFTIFLSVLGLGGSAEGFASISSWFSGDSVMSNVPTCALCFGLPDLLAQVLEDRGREIDLKQVLSAACIGVVMNAVGFEIWLHYLEIMFPSDVVGFGSGAHGVLLLLLKSLADSLVWGTASNTAVLIGKRKLAGDSWAGAIAVWNSTIMDVTRTELKFWPVWQAINFCCVPKYAQVTFMSVGELTWNSFLCITASRVGGTSQH